MVVLEGLAVSYERGTPVALSRTDRALQLGEPEMTFGSNLVLICELLE